MGVGAGISIAIPSQAASHIDEETIPMKSFLRILGFLLLSLGFAARLCSAQSILYPPVTIPGTELRTLNSAYTGHSYDLYIRKPADYDKSKDKKYPVLYLLDGQWDFKLLDSVVGGLVYDKWMPDIVVVGITYSGVHPDYDALRAMDYTPTPGQQNGSGGGPKFLHFIKAELIPFMERNYRGDPARRIIGGHSLGGLFTLYAMFTDPTLFWGYLSGSPAIPWDNNFLVKQEAEYAKRQQDLPVRLFCAVGGAEPLLTPDISFVKTLAARNYNGLQWDGRVIEAERHSGVKPEFYERGLRFIFSNE
jgi:predicted alpha/beta superfamily hydrolase